MADSREIILAKREAHAKARCKALVHTAPSIFVSSAGYCPACLQSAEQTYPLLPRVVRREELFGSDTYRFNERGELTYRMVDAGFEDWLFVAHAKVSPGEAERFLDFVKHPTREISDE